MSGDGKTCVVLDANVWIGQMLLNSSLGAAFLYQLRAVPAVIGLPEVVEMEVMARIVDEVKDARAAVERNLAKIRSLVGETNEIDLPPDQELKAAVQARFSILDEFIRRIPISASHYRQALVNVINRVSPNATREQYRDSLIWEAVKELSADYRITLITDDKDFYQGKDPQKGLAADLREQCLPGREVFLFGNIEQYLTSFKDKMRRPNYETMVSAIDEEINSKGSVLLWASKRDFSVGELKDYSIKAFLTERVGVFALTFQLTYRILDVLETQTIIDGKLLDLDEPIEHAEAVLRCSGDCYFQEKDNTVSDLRVHDIDCFALDGHELVGFGGGYMYGFSGNRAIPHRIRRPID